MLRTQNDMNVFIVKTSYVAFRAIQTRPGTLHQTQDPPSCVGSMGVRVEGRGHEQLGGEMGDQASGQLQRPDSRGRQCLRSSVPRPASAAEASASQRSAWRPRGSSGRRPGGWVGVGVGGELFRNLATREPQRLGCLFPEG